MSSKNLRIGRALRRHSLAAIVASGASVAGCSATLIEPQSCSADIDCRRAFGWGSTCESEGFCSEVQTLPRCARTYPDDLLTAPDRYRDAVVFGGLFSYVDHVGTLQAAELAIRLANASGVSPHTYALVTCDTAAQAGDDLDDVEATIATTRYLVDTLGVSAIVGPRGSTRTEAAWSVVAEAPHTMLISPSATSTSLVGLDTPTPTDEAPGRLWRTVPPDRLQSVAVAQDLRSRGVDTISIVEQSGIYGDSLTELLSEEFVSRGGNPPTVERYTTSLADAVASVSDDDAAQEIVVISSEISDYVAFLEIATSTSASSNFFDARGLFFSDGAFNERLYTDPVSSAELLFDNIRGSRPAPAEGPLFNAFVFEYFDVFDESPDALGFTAHAYDAAWLVLYASLWAEATEGEITGLGIAKGLRRMSSGPSVEIRATSWPQAIESLGAGESIDVAGSSGALDFDPSTEETSAPIEIWRLSDDNGWTFVREMLVDP